MKGRCSLSHGGKVRRRADAASASTGERASRTWPESKQNPVAALPGPAHTSTPVEWPPPRCLHEMMTQRGPHILAEVHNALAHVWVHDDDLISLSMPLTYFEANRKPLGLLSTWRSGVSSFS